LAGPNHQSPLSPRFGPLLHRLALRRTAIHSTPCGAAVARVRAGPEGASTPQTSQVLTSPFSSSTELRCLTRCPPSSLQAEHCECLPVGRPPELLLLAPSAPAAGRRRSSGAVFRYLQCRSRVRAIAAVEAPTTTSPRSSVVLVRVPSAASPESGPPCCLISPSLVLSLELSSPLSGAAGRAGPRLPCCTHWSSSKHSSCRGHFPGTECCCAHVQRDVREGLVRKRAIQLSLVLVHSWILKIHRKLNTAHKNIR
jgi:hypothetical protein